MTPIGPFWRYYGGKWRAAGRYPPPSFDTIVEPFAGAAGYSCRYWRYRVVLVDKSPIIAGIWRYLIAATPREILALPDIPEGGTVDDMDAPQEARWLAGFWCNNGVAHPCKRPSKWAKTAASGPGWGGWGWVCRQRIAADVERIKHWSIIEGDYSMAPEGPATWFIDPPYQTAAGRHYKEQPASFEALGEWARTRQGQRIICDQEGSTWCDWNEALTLQASPGRYRDGTSREVAMIEDDNPRQRLLLPLKEKR